MADTGTAAIIFYVLASLGLFFFLIAFGFLAYSLFQGSAGGFTIQTDETMNKIVYTMLGVSNLLLIAAAATSLAFLDISVQVIFNFLITVFAGILIGTTWAKRSCPDYQLVPSFMATLLSAFSISALIGEAA